MRCLGQRGIKKSGIMDLKDRIKVVRGKLTQKEFASRLGIHEGTVQLYEAGNIPEGDILMRIHTLFHVDMNWLLAGEVEPFPEKRPNGVSQRTAPSSSHQPYPMTEAIGVVREIFDSRNQNLIKALTTFLHAIKLTYKEVKGLKEQRNADKMVGEVQTRFGQSAVNKGYIKADDLLEALQIQVQEDINAKNHRFLGEILVQQGKMTVDQVNEILRGK
jgi:transcriptional regulator with XRE-family HTH domain